MGITLIACFAIHDFTAGPIPMTTNAQLDTPPSVRFDAEGHIRHVTIRQIIRAERMHDTAPLMIEGHKVSSVMIVANIFDFVDKGDGTLNFNLDDGTGRIKCSLRGQSSICSTFGHFVYVRARGTITQPPAREIKYLQATHLENVTDFHEVFYHTLEVINHSAHLRKLNERPLNEPEHTNARDVSPRDNLDGHESDATIRPETACDPYGDYPASITRDYGELNLKRDDWFLSNSGTARTVSSSTTASYHTAYSQRSPSPESPAGYYQDTDSLHFDTPMLNSRTAPRMGQISRNNLPDPYWRLDSLQREIIICISNALQDTETLYPHSGHRVNGVNIKVIVQGLRARIGGQLNEPEVSSAIEHLLSEAYIFTTIDDQHYNLVQMYKQRS